MILFPFFNSFNRLVPQHCPQLLRPLIESKGRVLSIGRKSEVEPFKQSIFGGVLPEFDRE